MYTFLLGYILGDFFTNSSGHPVCNSSGLKMTREPFLLFGNKVDFATASSLAVASWIQTREQEVFGY
jgi:hypothetical protein